MSQEPVTEAEFEAAVLAVLDALPKPWRTVVAESGLHPATVSRLLERLKMRNQVLQTAAGYVRAPTESPLTPQKRPSNEKIPPLGASPTPLRTDPSPTQAPKRVGVTAALAGNPTCTVCGERLTEENWTPGARKMGWRKCKEHLRGKHNVPERVARVTPPVPDPDQDRVHILRAINELEHVLGMLRVLART